MRLYLYGAMKANNVGVDVKARSHWLLGYGLPRALLKLLAHRGDPFAQLLIDSSRPQNVYGLVEQIRRRGRISPVVGHGWVTADARIVRDVLRDSRFPRRGGATNNRLGDRL
ncbi:hypothetical protein [Mycobacterium paraseoulense]|uniref:Uncharacterized protein n=1 Tax=Mycobacterium paraseoulense TaxID=590652 RepID=A0A1X0IEQ0_9MYCO|nr:hypothetical protein [Mycobacterium paraseoulense]MCV7397233.1 hypothetical protein [Mycobacterium paraseoulense]ORB43907.1 hypothetical protein BST39_07805 [Mycobacterium paraseoulense]BBZ69835.1 hypothetical protein MPRS_09280 [Mycobacterium paraseoulense]